MGEDQAFARSQGDSPKIESLLVFQRSDSANESLGKGTEYDTSSYKFKKELINTALNPEIPSQFDDPSIGRWVPVSETILKDLDASSPQDTLLSLSDAGSLHAKQYGPIKSWSGVKKYGTLSAAGKPRTPGDRIRSRRMRVQSDVMLPGLTVNTRYSSAIQKISSASDEFLSTPLTSEQIGNIYPPVSSAANYKTSAGSTSPLRTVSPVPLLSDITSSENELTEEENASLSTERTASLWTDRTTNASMDYVPANSSQHAEGSQNLANLDQTLDTSTSKCNENSIRWWHNIALAGAPSSDSIVLLCKSRHTSPIDPMNKHSYLYALKIRLRDEKTNKDEQEETSIIKELRSPLIVSLVDSMELPRHTLLLMEYRHGGDLFGFVQNDHEFLVNSHVIQALIAQIAAAIFFLHKNLVAHQDLKPESINLHSAKFKCD